MILVVHELLNGLAQQITVGPRRIDLAAIRPHLYRHNSPAGTLWCEVTDLSGNLIATSEVLQAAAVGGSGAYWHGDQRFLITAQLKENTAYQIALFSGGGYGFTESAYVGWCSDWDLRKVPANYSPSDGINAALLLELWEYREDMGGSG